MEWIFVPSAQHISCAVKEVPCSVAYGIGATTAPSDIPLIRFQIDMIGILQNDALLD